MTKDWKIFIILTTLILASAATLVVKNPKIVSANFPSSGCEWVCYTPDNPSYDYDILNCYVMCERYDTPYPYPYEYQYQYEYEYEYQYQTPYTYPYPTVPPPPPVGGGYGYQYQYQSPPAYGTPASYTYQSPVGTYPSPYATPVTFDYSLTNTGTVNAAKSAGSDVNVRNIVTKNLISGTSVPVMIDLFNVPSGVSYSISNDPCSPTCHSDITLTVTPSAPVGTHHITVSSSPLSRQTAFDLIITSSPVSVSCSVAPASSSVGQDVTWTATVSGGTAPYSYAWSGTNIGTPAPSTNPYVKKYSTVGLKTAAVAVTDAVGQRFTCAPAIIQVNFNPIFEEF